MSNMDLMAYLQRMNRAEEAAEAPTPLESLAAAHTTDLREQSKHYAGKAMPDGVGE
jgi:hypothetical protein